MPRSSQVALSPYCVCCAGDQLDAASSTLRMLNARLAALSSMAHEPTSCCSAQGVSVNAQVCCPASAQLQICMQSCSACAGSACRGNAQAPVSAPSCDNIALQQLTTVCVLHAELAGCAQGSACAALLAVRLLSDLSKHSAGATAAAEESLDCAGHLRCARLRTKRQCAPAVLAGS